MSVVEDVNCNVEELLRGQQRYKLLKSRGLCVPGLSPNVNPNEKPLWFDAKRFKEAQRVCQKYFVSLFLAHLSGLMFLFQMPTLAPVFEHIDTHSTIANLFKRYLDTFIHLKDWYESDPYETRSRASVSLKYVRLMHKQIYVRMNQDDSKESKETVWASQYDMVLTQWSIVAPFLLFPKKCGMHNVTKKEMEQFLYFWRVLGRILGIEDEYNCCTGNYDECLRFNQLLWENDFKPVLTNLKYPSTIGFESAKGLTISLQSLAPIISLQGLMRYWYRFFGITHYVPVDYKFGYKSMVYFIDTLLQYSIVHYMASAILRFSLVLQTWRQNMIKKQLEKQYAHIVYKPECPFSYKSPSELLSY